MLKARGNAHLECALVKIFFDDLFESSPFDEMMGKLTKTYIYINLGLSNIP